LETKNEVNGNPRQHVNGRNEPNKRYLDKYAIREELEQLRKEISNIKNQNQPNRTELLEACERRRNSLQNKMKRGESHSIIAKGKMQSTCR
jgi:flagellin-like hook-associated protein FlgL